MHVVLCYPFFDLRFLMADVARPAWPGGTFRTVGSFGPVIQDEFAGTEAEIRADAALAFGKEQQWREKLIESDDAEAAASSGGKKRKFRQRKYASVDLGNGITVSSRRMLATSDGHVRLELILEDALGGHADTLADRLETALTNRVYVVREEGRPELVNAGFNVARLYFQQSSKTTKTPSPAVLTQLVREGAGSPFLVVLHEGPPAGEPDGTPIADKPAMFAAVTCQLMNVAGRSTGVWQIWGAGRPADWIAPMRMLCRIICQLSEMTSIARLRQEPQAYAPHKLDDDHLDQFFRVRGGQLNRQKQGVWSVAAVEPLAAQHIRVATDEALHTRASLTQFLRRDSAGVVEQKLSGITQAIGATPMIQEADRVRLADLLARLAANEAGYFDRLVQQANLPAHFQSEWPNVETGDAGDDAARLIDWALAKKTNPAEPSRATLASLLLPELARLELADAAMVVAFISIYRLIHDSAEMEELRVRYQSPLAVPGAPAPGAIGPNINWQGPPDTIELQSWFAPEPTEWDVGFMAKAIENAASVCLVSVPGNGEKGTGVLIGERLVLTNYHVVQSVLDGGLQMHPASLIEVMFGKYGDGSAVVTTTLDPVEPVLDWSPTTQLDYALLKLSGTVGGLASRRAATLSATTPNLKAALNILQHPRGGDMKLVPTGNAVTHIDAAAGLIQYVTRTSKGSSGAPCFDDQWEVVAIHHAERSQTFGTIREGILIGHIRERIKKHLN